MGTAQQTLRTRLHGARRLRQALRCRGCDQAASGVRSNNRLACAQAQQPYRLRVMPRWLLKPAGWWVPALRENHN